MSKILWRDIPGYEGLYQCSRCGRVRSLDRDVGGPYGSKRRIKGKELKSSINTHGYKNGFLCKDGKYKTYRVHALVALVWIGPRPDGFDISHIDENQTHNDASNLRYLSKSEHFRLDQGRAVKRSDGVIFPSLTDAAESKLLVEIVVVWVGFAEEYVRLMLVLGGSM